MRAFRLRLALVRLAAFFEDLAAGQPRFFLWFALPGALASFACAFHYFTTPFEIDKYGRSMTRLEMLAFGTATATMGLVLTGFVVFSLVLSRKDHGDGVPRVPVKGQVRP